jgi:hypothetical protein
MAARRMVELRINDGLHRSVDLYEKQVVSVHENHPSQVIENTAADDTHLLRVFRTRRRVHRGSRLRLAALFASARGEED